MNKLDDIFYHSRVKAVVRFGLKRFVLMGKDGLHAAAGELHTPQQQQKALLVRPTEYARTSLKITGIYSEHLATSYMQKIDILVCDCA